MLWHIKTQRAWRWCYYHLRHWWMGCMFCWDCWVGVRLEFVGCIYKDHSWCCAIQSKVSSLQISYRKHICLAWVCRSHPIRGIGQEYCSYGRVVCRLYLHSQGVWSGYLGDCCVLLWVRRHWIAWCYLLSRLVVYFWVGQWSDINARRINSRKAVSYKFLMLWLAL